MTGITELLFAFLVWVLYAWAAVVVGTLGILFFFSLKDWLDGRRVRVAPRPRSVDEVEQLESWWALPSAQDGPRRSVG